MGFSRAPHRNLNRNRMILSIAIKIKITLRTSCAVYSVVLLLLTLAAAGPAHAGSELAEIRRRGEVVIGTDATYPPFEEKVGDGFQGFDIDLGNAVARELGPGVKARWVNISFDGIFAALLSGKFDLVMSGVTITPERQKQMAFSDPYYNSGQIIAVRKENTTLRRPEDLRGKVAAV